MNSEDRVDWEAYAKALEKAREKENSRQSAAYQNLEVEMTKLLQFLQESQRNQNDFMIESAQLISNCTNNFQVLRQNVMSFLQESRGQASSSNVEQLKWRLDAITSQMEKFSMTLAQLSSHGSLHQESSHLIRPSQTAKIAHESTSTQQFSPSSIQEKSLQTTSSYGPFHVSSSITRGCLQ